MSKLAGFTAMITLNDETWAGTDFSHRPNYLLNLETGEKIFLPRPAFTAVSYTHLTLPTTNLGCR
ncbi:hypothetical protein ACN6PZ_18905, partial [Acinetobacter baumannii]